MATSDLILARVASVTRVMTLGDNVYQCGSPAQFAAGYFAYFGATAQRNGADG
jgi:hypothetical protein